MNDLNDLKERMISDAISVAVHDAHANAKEKGWWESKEADALDDVADMLDADDESCPLAALHAEDVRSAAKKLRARNDGELIALMHAELSEAVEYLRKGKDSPSDHIPEFSGVEEEMADVLIRIFDFCGARNLRLGPAVVAKMRFNKTRPVRHGGKAF